TEASAAIESAINALINFDSAACLAIIEHDRDIDQMERDIEHRCLQMLLRQQPVAGDLRQISTAIKMITDIERIGDAAADIAEIAKHITRENLPNSFLSIPKMAKLAQKMVENAITSYVNLDLELANATRLQDDMVDEMFNILKTELAEDMSKDKATIDSALDCLMIIKYVERLGDHAVNICEWVEFCLTGIHKQTRIV
ncbi:MAG: phosphate signaling complex protein PhoU, partial [Oscillospiraceae bacterium]